MPKLFPNKSNLGPNYTILERNWAQIKIKKIKVNSKLRPSWSNLNSNRLWKKNAFSGSEKLYFSQCLHCFQSTQNQYLEIRTSLTGRSQWSRKTATARFGAGVWLGWGYVFFFTIRKIIFFGTALVRLRNEMLQLFFLCPRANPWDKPGFAKIQFFRLWKFAFSHAPC